MSQVAATVTIVSGHGGAGGAAVAARLGLYLLHLLLPPFSLTVGVTSSSIEPLSQENPVYPFRFLQAQVTSQATSVFPRWGGGSFSTQVSSNMAGFLCMFLVNTSKKGAHHFQAERSLVSFKMRAQSFGRSSAPLPAALAAPRAAAPPPAAPPRPCAAAPGARAVRSSSAGGGPTRPRDVSTCLGFCIDVSHDCLPCRKLAHQPLAGRSDSGDSGIFVQGTTSFSTCGSGFGGVAKAAEKRSFPLRQRR